MSRRDSSSRTLSLHPSALSDAEHVLFAGSLASLIDQPADTIDWDRAAVSVREARAWLCGRYPDLGAGTVDEILRLFAPATTLSAGAFAAVLRLALHAQAGSTVQRSMAFVQAPVPPTLSRLNTAPTNPFLTHSSLPTPAPSPEAHTATRAPLPYRAKPAPSSISDSASAWSSTSSASAASLPSPTRRHTHTHAHSSSLSAIGRAYPMAGSTPALPSPGPPPTHPLRRAVTVSSSTKPSPPGPAAAPSSPALQRSPSASTSGSNPFTRHQQTYNPPRPPPLPPRRASTSSSTAPFHPATSPFSDPAPAPASTRALPRTAPATKTAFSPVRGTWEAYVQPPTPVDPPSSRSAFSAPSTHGSGPVYTSRRVVSDSSPSASASPSRPPLPPRTDSMRGGGVDLEKSRVVRRTLAGAGWVGAEAGEREGLLG